MAKSGNTWFKIKRNKMRVVGGSHWRTLRHAAPDMDIVELARKGEVKRKAVEPRKTRRPVGFDYVPHGAASAARREKYHRQLGFA